MKKDVLANWQLTQKFHYRDDVIAWDVFGQGSPVVLAHGFPGNSFAWRNIVPILAKTHRIYVYDMPGFGASSKYSGQEVDARSQARLLAALLEHWKISRPDIVAHDFGAAVALGAAFFDRCTVNRLILLDPAILNPCLRELSRHGRTYHEAYATMPAKLFAHIMRFILPSAMHGSMSESVFESYFRPWANPEGQSAYYRFLSQFDDTFLDLLETTMPTCNRPISILWGKEDTWIPIDQAYRLQKLFPNVTIDALPGAGHFIMEDKPAEVTQKIRHILVA